MDAEDPLSTAINDFLKKRSILVSVYTRSVTFFWLISTHLLLAQYRSDMGMELCLPDTQQSLEADVGSEDGGEDSSKDK